MTRDEALISAALEMAASKAHDTCPECGYRTDASAAIRAIDPAEVLAPAPQAEGHPDDLAVDRFAAAMKTKLARKRDEGRGGWERKDECSAEDLTYMLVQHIWKGDPLDVGNLAMMLHQRGERIVLDGDAKSITPSPSAATPTAQKPVAWMLRDMEGVICAFTTKLASYDAENWEPLYAHPPQPSETVAEAGIVNALEIGRAYVAEWVKNDGGINQCDIGFRADLEAIDAALRALKGDA